MVDRFIVSFVALTLVAVSAAAADYERILLPILGGGQAAFGSEWRTDLWVRNDGDAAVEVFPFATLCFPQSSRCDITPVRQVGPRTTLQYLTIGTSFSIFPAFIPISDLNAGVIVYVERSGADAVRFSIHVRDISRTNQNLGSEVPAVREKDLRSGPTSLTNISVLSNYRYSLRIYGVEASAEARFTFRIFEPALIGETLLEEQTVRLTPPNVTLNCGSHAVCPWPALQFAPAYAFVPLDLVALRPDFPVRIEVESDAQSKFWCLLSATNNDTQLITIYSPR